MAEGRPARYSLSGTASRSPTKLGGGAAGAAPRCQSTVDTAASIRRPSSAGDRPEGVWVPGRAGDYLTSADALQMQCAETTAAALPVPALLPCRTRQSVRARAAHQARGRDAGGGEGQAGWQGAGHFQRVRVASELSACLSRCRAPHVLV